MTETKLHKTLVQRFPEINALLNPIFSTCDLCASDDELLAKFRDGDGFKVVSYVIDEVTKKSLEHSKDSQKANETRRQGNDFFAAKDYQKAHNSYTESIMKSVLPAQSDTSLELALAFGARSAANYELGQLAAALEDIENAIKYGYPREKIPKLRKRKLNCLMMQRHQTRDESEEENEKIRAAQKIEEPNPKIPCASNKIKIDSDTVKGRKIVATKDIPFCELILIEDAYAKIMLPYNEVYRTHCNYCNKRLFGGGIPCLTCDEVLYCSPTCRELAEEQFHVKECRFMSEFFACEPKLLLVSRILLKATLTSAIQIWNSINTTQSTQSVRSQKKETKAKYLSDYKSIANLRPKEEEGNGLFYAAFSAVCLRVWLEKQHRIGINWNNKKRFQLDHMILVHILQLGSNSILTQEKYRDPVSNAAYTDISYALFPTVALFNHSCKRETLLLNIGNQMRVFAGRDIKAGEEIYFDYYTTFVKTYTYKDRQAKIYKDNGFYCRCTFCEEQFSPPQIAYLCPNCKGTLFINLDDTNQCSNCKSCCDQQKVEWLKNTKAEGLAKAKLAEGIESDAAIASILKEAFSILSQVLHPNNGELDQVRKSLLERYVNLNQLNKALPLAKMAAESHKEVYGLNSFEYVIAQKEVIVIKFRQLQASKDKNNKRAAEIRSMAIDHIEKYENLIKVFKTYKSITAMEKELEPLKMVKNALTNEDD